MGDVGTDALRRAVEANPDDVELRLLLAGRLLDDDPRGALAEATAVLDRDPAHVAALRMAARAADAAGEADRAVGYRRLVRALGGDDGVEPALTPAALDDAGQAPHEPHEPSLVERPNELGPVVETGVTLDDVGGLDEVKRRLHATFLGPLENPQLRSAFRSSLRGGLLLYGPPGCGKTFLARALAGELGARFVEITLTDVLDPYLGVSERQLHGLFEAARRNAPCVVFLDEIDALGHKRTAIRGSAGRNVVNQLLVELDAAQSSNDGLYVLAATNHPWDVDAALRRPGRFDRTLLVLPPDAEARRTILERELRDRPVGSVNLPRLARATDGYSGADLAHVVATATEAALARSADAGTISPIQDRDLRQAVGDVMPSVGPWTEVARNYALYANEGGQYDELSRWLQSRRLL